MTDLGMEPAGRYVSYHSRDTYSISDTACVCIRKKQRFRFEYNGVPYSIEYRPEENKWVLLSHGQMGEYLMPWASGTLGIQVAEFDDADRGIKEFEIEGKTIEWILDNQRWWKYKFSSAHLERILTGFSFCFVYRKTPCMIVTSGPDPKKHPFAFDGRYIIIGAGTKFDPTHYAPFRRLEKHWFEASTNLGIWRPDITDRSLYNLGDIKIGPFKTDGELLDMVGSV
jgi:hypothetical protein